MSDWNDLKLKIAHCSYYVRTFFIVTFLFEKIIKPICATKHGCQCRILRISSKLARPRYNLIHLHVNLDLLRKVYQMVEFNIQFDSIKMMTHFVCNV